MSEVAANANAEAVEAPVGRWTLLTLAFLGVLALLVLLSGSQPAAADDLGGNVKQGAICDETWSGASFGHYHVVNNVTVGSGCFLTITGTTVYFDTFYDGMLEMEIQGGATFTVTNSAVLTDLNYYYDMEFQSGSTVTLTGGSIIQYAGCSVCDWDGIKVTDADVTWGDVTVRWGGQWGVFYDLPAEVTFDGTTLTENALGGVYFDMSASPFTLHLWNSDVSGNYGAGIYVSSGGDLTVDCVDSNVDGNWDDGFYASSVGDVLATFDGCTFDANWYYGFYLYDIGGGLTLDSLGTTFDLNGYHGLGHGGGEIDGDASITLDQSSVSGNAWSGLWFDTIFGNLSFLMTASTVDGNWDYGARFGSLLGSGTQTFDLSDSTLDGNGIDGMYLNYIDPGSLVVTLFNTSASSDGDDGFEVPTVVAGDVSVFMTDSFIDGNGGDGLDFGDILAGNLTFTADPSTIDGNSANGFIADYVDGWAYVDLADTSVSGNGGVGVGTPLVGNGLGMSVANANLSGNSGPALYADTVLNGNVSITISNSTLNGNFAGVFLETVLNGSLTIDVDPTTIVGNLYGVYANNVFGSVAATFQDVNISANSIGVYFANPYGNLSMWVTNANVSGNLYGLVAGVVLGNTSWTLTNVSMVGNTFGIYLVAILGNLTAWIENSTFDYGVFGMYIGTVLGFADISVIDSAFRYNVYGIFLNTVAGGLRLDIDPTTFANNTYAAFISTVLTSLEVSVLDSSFTGNAVGFYLATFVGGTTNDSIAFRGNTFENNTGLAGAVLVGNLVTGNLTMDFADNRFAYNYWGVYVDTVAEGGVDGRFEETWINNTVMNNTAFGIWIGNTILGVDTTTTLVSTRPMTGNGIFAFWHGYVQAGNQDLVMDLDSMEVSLNGNGGIWFSGYDGVGTQSIEITNTQVNWNGGDGIYLFGGGGCYRTVRTSILVQDSWFLNNSGDGFYMECLRGDIAVVDFTDVEASGNGGHGIYLGGTDAVYIATYMSQGLLGSSSVWDPVNNVAYIFGGATCLSTGCITDVIAQYDPATDEVTPLGTLPSERYFTAAVWDSSRDVAYIIGGGDCWSIESCSLTHILQFDPATGNVTSLGNLSLPLVGASAVFDDVANVVYIFGGYNSNWGTPMPDIWRFDPADGSLLRVGLLPWYGNYLSTAVWDGRYAYLFGGYDDCNWWCEWNQVLRFDPLTGRVDVVAYLPDWFQGSGSANVGGTILIFGGDTCYSGCWENWILEFDPATGRVFDTGLSLDTGFVWGGVATDGERAYLFGGLNCCWPGDDAIQIVDIVGSGTGDFVRVDAQWNGVSGIYVGQFAGHVTMLPMGFPVSNNGCSGVYVGTVYFGDFVIDLAGHQVTDNGCDGVYLGGNYFGSVWVDLTGANVSGNGGAGIYLLGANCYPMVAFDVFLDASQYTFNGNDGLYVGCVRFAPFNLVADNLLFQNNGDYGIYMEGAAETTAMIQVTNNRFIGNGGGIYLGYFTDFWATGWFEVWFTDNLIDGAGGCCGEGIYIDGVDEGFADGSYYILRNIVRYHQATGIYFYEVYGCEDCWPPIAGVRNVLVDISDNVVTYNLYEGIYFGYVQVAAVTLLLDPNIVEYNEYGFYFDEANYGGRLWIYIQGGSYSYNEYEGIYLDGAEDDGSFVYLSLEDVRVLDNAPNECCYAGVYVYEADEGRVELFFQNATISGSYYALWLERADDSSVYGEIHDSTLSGVVYGLYTETTNDGDFKILFVNSTVLGATTADLYLDDGEREYITMRNSYYGSLFVDDQFECDAMDEAPCSRVLHQWWYHIRVFTGANLDMPAPNVDVSVWENGVLVSSGRTGADGMIWWLIGNEWLYALPYQIYYTTTIQASNGVVTAFATAIIDTNEMVITLYLRGDNDADGLADNVDPDDDNDLVVDGSDAFPFDPAEQFDSDGDGVGDNADTDDDNDGVPDASDACPIFAGDYLDTDSDGICDSLDSDDDGDGVVDANDDFPLDPAEWNDLDGDGTGDNADLDRDGDGVNNTADQFPDDGAEWWDTDGDGLGNNADPDDDNDGIVDANDTFPYDPNEWMDNDGDGVGDNADPDDDNDNFPDTTDPQPLVYNPPPDLDGDGVPDFLDLDRDGDGVDNGNDTFPDNRREWRDNDGDGIGDNSDFDDDNDNFADLIEIELGTDPNSNASAPSDMDGDGVPDAQDDDMDGDGISNANDEFPSNPGETRDNDGDGIGDNADTDDDNDGVPDATDPSPYVAQDADNDGVPDLADPDDDNDGTPDTSDDFPLNPNESRDTDGDGIGDNADWDDDGDGFGDSVEIGAGSDPLNPASVPPPPPVDNDRDDDGIPNADDAFPDNPNEWSDFDQDGVGDNSDWDDDNDGYSDQTEAQGNSDPLNATSKPADLDGDFIIDALDPDRDGDGVPNETDAFPDNPAKSEPAGKAQVDAMSALLIPLYVLVVLAALLLLLMMLRRRKPAAPQEAAALEQEIATAQKEMEREAAVEETKPAEEPKMMPSEESSTETSAETETSEEKD